jgi:serine/threonine protein kinase
MNPSIQTARARINSFEDSVAKHLIDGKYLTSFKQKEILGYGGFGVVYKVLHKLEKQEYAVKIVPLNFYSEAMVTRSLFREIDAMLRMNNERVVRYVTCWLESFENLKDTLKELEDDEESEEGSSEYSGSASYSNSGSMLSSATTPAGNKIKAGLFIQMELVTGSTLKQYLDNPSRTVDCRFN